MTRNTLSAAFGLCFLAAAAIYVAGPDRDGSAGGVTASVHASRVIDGPFVMFRTLAPKEAHGRVAMVAAAAPDTTRYISALACARVHFGGGVGLCVTDEARGATVRHAVYIFDRAFARGRRIDLGGTPTRVRVSPNGKLAAITVYAEEHAPDGGERLATRALVFDLAGGDVILDLRDVTIDSSGHTTFEGPVDFSNLAFTADSDGFFATMSASAQQYVISGSIASRRAEIIAAGLTNESLSPDGRHLIAKTRSGEHGRWQLGVWDVAAKTWHALNQGPRSVDDQVEWLDPRRVIFHDATEQGTGVWVLAIDDQAGPALLISEAYSPSVQQ